MTVMDALVANEADGPYHPIDGIMRRPGNSPHRERDYDTRGFAILAEMQRTHFWYRARHRFLFHAVERTLPEGLAHRRVLDLGGGCGGWLSYFIDHARPSPAEVALGDSSLHALQAAGPLLPRYVRRYQADLLSLGWRDRWDIIFLLDVLEHLRPDRKALEQLHEALAPGGLLFVTTPALRWFWTWNDEAVGHQRRYSCEDFGGLAAATGFHLVDARYFMCVLAPLMLGARWLKHWTYRRASDEKKWSMVEYTHRTPSPVVNGLLTTAASAETPLGHYFRFPFGTSVLAILRKSDP